MPHFLSNAAPDAEVHSGFLDILDNFQQDQDGREHLADTVKELTGGLFFLWLFSSLYAAGQGLIQKCAVVLIHSRSSGS